jgi:hypothetical protein
MFVYDTIVLLQVFRGSHVFCKKGGCSGDSGLLNDEHNENPGSHDSQIQIGDQIFILRVCLWYNSLECFYFMQRCVTGCFIFCRSVDRFTTILRLCATRFVAPT